ncbi:hypothetical protein [Acuticoccus sediminis]|uniref:hypothetical protein n=1 Tax=Acuticoccus sediminis TaxID=2184697 RepID=UPI001CFD8A02|nr:hypothetical protein [Acuticoccus sediminis]
MKIRLRCLPGYAGHVPEPVLARRSLPEWLRTMPPSAESTVLGAQVRTVKQCLPFVEAMQTGLIFRLAADLTLKDGTFSWNSGLPVHPVARLSRAPIGVHVPEQATGAPFADPHHFIVKFTNHWTVSLPDGFGLLVGHPYNREDLPFRTLWGVVERFDDGFVHFPALWTDHAVNVTVPRGTPVAQAVPIPLEPLDLDIAEMDDGELARHIDLEDRIQSEPGHYRRTRRG